MNGACNVTKSISKIFMPNFVCSLMNERDRILILSPGSCPGALGVPRGSKKNFKHGYVPYQIEGDDKQSRLRVKYSCKGQAGDLGVRSNSIKFWLPCRFHTILYQTFINLVCVLTNERYKTYQTRFSLCDLGQGWDCGALGVPRGVIFFSNMVMWYIKSTGMASRT